jgi:hypothetical protein
MSQPPVWKRVRRLAAAVSATLACTSPLDAQGTLRGVLHDSLRALGPLAGAEVVLIPGGRRVTTDLRGRFVFSDVPAGDYRVGYAALWLDSVGVAPLSVPVRIPATRNVIADLVIPSRAALTMARCGGVMDAGRGLVVGELRDADARPIDAAIVVARWSEFEVGGSAYAVPKQYVAADTTGPDGRYALCGMPDGAEILVAARHPDGRATGTIVLLVSPGVLAHDMVLGEQASRARVRARVLTADSVPLPGADVIGTSSGVVRTDSAGRVELQVEAGSRQVAIRALGYRPRLIDLRVGDSPVELGDIVLDRVNAVLDTMVIRAAPLTLAELEFDYRRRTRNGSFLDEQTLRRLPQASPAAVAGMSAPWVHAPGGQSIAFRGTSIDGGRVYCRPRLFVDGVDWGNRISAEEIRGLLQFARRIEMYRAAFAPPEFTDFDGCGALVIWII